MEALPISPAKASHQTAKPQGLSGLGDVFQALLQEATVRLEARPADLAAFETRRSTGEPTRRPSAAETLSSFEAEDRRAEAAVPHHRATDDVTESRNAAEPVVRDDPTPDDADDTEVAALTTDDDAESVAALRTDDAPLQSDDDVGTAGAATAEPLPPAAADEGEDDPVEIAVSTGLPTQAQSQSAAATAFDALARAAAQSQLPAAAAPQAQAAGSVIPAAANTFAIDGGASRVQVTPAAVVAPPHAALGGGAAAATLAAEAAQLGAQNGSQNAAGPAAQNAQATQQGAAVASQALVAGATATLQQQARPSTRTGQGESTANGQFPTRGSETGIPGAASAQNGTSTAATTQNPVIAPKPAPSPGAQGPAAQASPSPAAGESGNANPQNVQTPFADWRNGRAPDAGTPGGSTPNSHGAEESAPNGLAQNARTETARTLGAPAPGGDAAAVGEQSGQAAATRTPSDPVQGARPANPDGTQSPAAQANRADASTQAGALAQANPQNTQAGTPTAMDRAAAPASGRRVETAGQTSPGSASASSFGLSQAATRTPQTLPAQARPAAASSLPANQVAVHIQRAVSAGQDRIRITLHPAELGQIDIKLQVGNDGNVKATVSVDRPDTFDLLQRDARGLEKALQDAGLKTDSGSLSFNLKGQSGHDTAAGRHGSESALSDVDRETPAEPELEPEIITAARPWDADRALDLHV